MLTFKQYLIEARIHGRKDQSWMHDAFTIADNNIRRAKQGYKEGATLQAELEYWNEYKDWINENRQILQTWYEEIKSDRDTFVEHAKDMLKGRETAGKVWEEANRLRQAEIWSGNIDQHDYKTYWNLIEDATKEEHDFTIMISNTMMDLLGGLRDEKY